MSQKKMLSPAEIAEYTVEVGIKKANTPNMKVLVSAFLAGGYIGLGSLGSIAAAYNLLANPATYGLGKAFSGLMSPTGLIFVLIAGADLFTGTVLVALAALKKKVRWEQVFKNWSLVWIGNLLGSLFVAWLVSLSGVFDWSSGLYGGVVIKNALSKLNFSWTAAIASGILCNWLVCATVWISYGAKDIIGKIVSAFFGIFLLISAGFEQVVANMTHLFAALFAKSNHLYLEAVDKTVADASIINIPNIFIINMIPVTIGNIIGGLVFVSGAYYFLFLSNDEINASTEIENESKIA